MPKDINPKVKEQLDALLGDAPAGEGGREASGTGGCLLCNEQPAATHGEHTCTTNKAQQIGAATLVYIKAVAWSGWSQLHI
jgi:hypothetical protein